MDRYHHHRLVSKRRPPLSPALPLSVFLTHPSSEKPMTEIFVSQLFFLLFKIITTSGRTKIASKVYNAFTSYKVSMWYVNHGVQLCTDWYSVLHDNGPTGAQHICRSVSGAWTDRHTAGTHDQLCHFFHQKSSGPTGSVDDRSSRSFFPPVNLTAWPLFWLRTR